MAPLYFHAFAILLAAGLSFAAVPSVLATAAYSTCTGSSTVWSTITSTATTAYTSTDWYTITLTSTVYSTDTLTSTETVSATVTATDTDTITVTSTVTETATPPPTTTSTTSTTKTTTTSTSTSTCGAAAPTTTSWTYLGCYPDNVSARTLNGFGGTFTGTNTVASCQTDCLNRGFDYAGVEDGVQCFCASSIKGGVIPGGTCTTACSGGGGTCGGVDAIDIYKATVAQCVTPWKYLGCYSDNVSSRILNGFGGTFSTNTVASCQTMCLQRGFNYAGVEDGVQCFCASSLGTSGTLEAESHCQTRCGGGVGTCGGVDAIGIYKVAT